jgi:pyruvate/2-oxoacid:ferredoxin oxidoreductase beta subunit
MGRNTKFSVHGKAIPGKIEWRKELAQICMMHANTFVAQTGLSPSPPSVLLLTHFELRW